MSFISGNLYFSNIELEDGRGGLSYVCIVQNSELRSLVQGDDQKISPQSGPGKLTLRGPAAGNNKRLTFNLVPVNFHFEALFRDQNNDLV